ncbi:response regulator [Acidovorax sp. HDW3]|uniref:tetratricopeptide repeat-containing response regulator n=1 Tax=Acidovorax sp. HDW3 TaxID=2714923 RepID=UPI00140B6B6D|nr:tetratricopeptide repeat-containing response regulator [Acidovorax sp. HDW3]QIL44724.1 response regulator [Acidovorax sp. HDW3]
MTSVALSQARVLVVDDFQGMRTILRDLVRSMGVSRVDTAANGKEALNQLRASRYDVVICDFNLGPGLNGQQVLDEGRLHDYVGVSTIWVMVTAEKTAEMIMGAAESKPDEYLLKPINQHILETRLERLIVRKQALRSVEEALRAQDWAAALARCNQLLAQEATKTPEVLRLKSEVLLKQGDWAAAQALFEGVLAQRSLPWARTGLGRVHYARGEYELARSQFRQVLEENRMFIEAADWLAKTLDAMGDKQQAQAVLQEAVKLSPNSASRQKTLGETAWHNGALDVARGALQKTIKISEFSSNKQAGAYVALARVLSEDNEPEMALQLLKRTGEVFKDSKEGAHLAIQVAAVQSAVYQQTGQTEQAQAAMAQAQQLLQLQGGAANAQTALELAHGLLALGRKDEACELMRTLVKSHHEDARISGQVQALFEQAQMGEEGRSLIAQSREEAVAINNQGVLLGREGQFAEGAKLLRRALEGLPASEVLMMNLCGLLIGQMRAEGKSDTLMLEIMGLLERVREINPDNAKYRQYLALLKAGAAPR